ncbi:hypothetical protein DBP15_26025, partial [Streptomyces sp. CS065A]
MVIAPEATTTGTVVIATRPARPVITTLEAATGRPATTAVVTLLATAVTTTIVITTRPTIPVIAAEPTTTGGATPVVVTAEATTG